MDKRRVIARRRGTAIVDTVNGIVVTAGRGRVFLLPGGGADHNESRTQAAMRELKEETSLTPLHAKFLFRHLGKGIKITRARLLSGSPYRSSRRCCWHPETVSRNQIYRLLQAWK